MKSLKKKSKKLVVNVEPCGKFLLIERLLAEEVTAGGIFLPGAGKRKLPQGSIIGIGAKCEHDWVVGDEVMFQEMGAFEFNEENMTLVPEDLVLVKFKK